MIARFALILLTLSVPSTGASAQTDDESTGLAAFSKLATGAWAKLDVPALSDFDRRAVLAALAECAADGPRLLRFGMRDGRFLRTVGSEASIVLDARASEGRNGFRPWLVLTTAGGEALLVGEREIEGVAQAIMVSETASYVRCPVGDQAG